MATPTPTYLSHVDGSSGATLSVTVQKLAPGATDQYFDPSDYTFKSGLTYTQKKIPLPEEAGGTENSGTYQAGIVGLSGAAGDNDPGLVRFRVHREDGGYLNRTIRVIEGYVVAGQFVRTDAFLSSVATPAQVYAQVESLLTTGLNLPELATLPGRTPTPMEALALLYLIVRYKSVSSAEALKFFDADGRLKFEALLASSETLFTRDSLTDVV